MCCTHTHTHFSDFPLVETLDVSCCSSRCLLGRFYPFEGLKTEVVLCCMEANCYMWHWAIVWKCSQSAWPLQKTVQQTHSVINQEMRSRCAGGCRKSGHQRWKVHNQCSEIPRSWADNQNSRSDHDHSTVRSVFSPFFPQPFVTVLHECVAPVESCRLILE